MGIYHIINKANNIVLTSFQAPSDQHAMMQCIQQFWHLAGKVDIIKGQ